MGGQQLCVPSSECCRGSRRTGRAPGSCPKLMEQLNAILLLSSCLILASPPLATGLGLQPQPTATNDIFYFELKENSKAATFVGKIPTKPGFTYRFNEEPREFILDPRSGVILTTFVPTDREAKDFYNLVVLSSSPIYPLEVKIKILDVNDNAPYWPPFINRNVSFSESAPVGTKLIIDTATDLDEGNTVYRMVSSSADDEIKPNALSQSERFNYRSESHRDPRNSSSPFSPFRLTYNVSSAFLHLEVADRLDREMQSNYLINISATDEGGLTAYLELQVQVLDVNDNPPIFDHSDYSVSLNESVGKGVSILQVRATDADEKANENSAINYYLLSEEYFAIDSETGIIFTTQEGPIDCGSPVSGGGTSDYKKICVFTVFAHDGGTPRQNGRAYVTVNLVDANDHKPQIKFRFFSRSDQATVDENANNGTIVAAVSVVDLDQEANGQTSLAITGGNHLGHFRLESTGSSHIIRVNGSLDRKKVSLYNVTITAHDHGTPPKSCTAFLIVNVSDVIDQEPTFARDLYAVDLSEAVPIGSFVASITAVDPDEGINANLYYSLSGANAHFFKMDTISGLVTTEKLINREEIDVFELRVTARDGGPNPKWAHTVLRVTLLDVNDQVPRLHLENHFDNSTGAYIVDVEENSRMRLQLKAIDQDLGPNGTVAFSLLYDYEGLFEIQESAKSWFLVSTRELDFEDCPQFKLPVIARDQGQPQHQLSSTTTLVVRVLDRDDHLPSVYPNVYFAMIPSNFKSVNYSVVVTRVLVRDPDILTPVTFSVDKAPDLGLIFQLFDLNPQSGELKLKTGREPLLRNLPKLIRFNITCNGCSQNGNRAQMNIYVINLETSSRKMTDAIGHVANVSVNITNVHDEAPQFVSSPYHVNWRENEVGVIGQFEAIGEQVEKRSENRINYLLKYNNEQHFYLNSSTAVLSVFKPIDREALGESVIELRIIAIDNRLLRLTGEGIIYINVMDVNDNRPAFARKNYAFALTENRVYYAQEWFGKLEATDPDPSDSVVFEILEPEARALFQVNPQKGQLTLAKDLIFDRELKPVYEFHVLAKDSKHQDEATVRVKIKDVNDCKPLFKAINGNHVSFPSESKVDLLLPIQVTESLPHDLFLFGFCVSDCDAEESPNSRVSFRINETTNPLSLFVINPETGVVRMVRSPLRESFYSLQVIAQDNAPINPLVSHLSVHLKLSNRNNVKVGDLLKRPAVISISESAKINQVVYEFEASRASDKSSIKISLLGGDVYENFRIDRNLLRINKPLDYERVRSYELFIEASQESVSTFELVKVRIAVKNENDNPPTFGLEVYNATIDEEVEEAIMVTQLFASDLDNDQDEVSEGMLKYKIIEPRDGPFRIDEKYGTIWTTSKVDRETNSDFNLVVSVEDEDGLSSSCKVWVTVEDKNDNPPRFTRLFSVNITENAPVGSFVIQVTSSDRDAGQFAEATYSFIGSAEAFEIEAHSGKVYLTSQLDREVKEEYLLMVSANDSSWRAQTTLTINVLDQNDNAPQFERKAYEFRRAATSRELRIGQVKATDADKGTNSIVEYSLKHSSQHFAINSQTGEINIKPHSLANLSYNNGLKFLNQHNLTVLANDKGLIPQSSESTVVITIVPDHDLVHVHDVKSAEIPTPFNLKNGTVIYNLGSKMILRSTETIRILYGDKVVFHGEGLVRPGDKYTYTLTAANKEFNIVLSIIEPNRFAPKFSKDIKTEVIIAENSHLSNPLLQLSATDDDSDGNNRGVTYSYKVTEWKWNERALEYYRTVFRKERKQESSHGNSQALLIRLLNQSTATKPILDPFRLESQSGTLYINGKLDYELIVGYRLEMIAKDSAWFGSKNTSIHVNVHIMDINDNQPIFTNRQTTEKMEVFENNAIGHIVGEVHALDFDSPPNGQLTFEIEKELDFQTFSISSRSGQIQALASFDYEAQSEYTLKVSAKNNERLKSSLLVTIKVIDIKELDPKFNPDPMSIGVIVVIMFFIILILVISTSFVIFHNQKKKQVRPSGNTSNNSLNQRKMAVKQHLPVNLNLHSSHGVTTTPTSTLLHPPLHNQSSLISQNHPTAPPLPPPFTKQRPPDVVESPPAPPVQSLAPPSNQTAPPAPPPSVLAPSSDDYSEILVAASSIAPSDIDLVYHYKGFRSRESNGHLHRHAPLTRLSPSVSELTAPRILTLHDLSPQGVPPGPPPNMAPPPPPTGKHQGALPSTLAPDSSDDEANTDDSFTSSEFDENYKMTEKESNMIFQRVW